MLDRGVASLTAQATTLDAIFNYLAQQAIKSDTLSQLEAFLKLSLRAQSQARATWEAISTIQNPPLAYVKQANIAQVQQVNNGVPHAGEKEIPPNELLEKEHYERLDTTTAGTTIENDSAMATVGQIHRAKDGGG